MVAERTEQLLNCTVGFGIQSVGLEMKVPEMLAPSRFAVWAAAFGAPS